MTGWQITQAGNAQFNSLIVRSSIVPGAVSDGSDVLNLTARQHGNGVSILTTISTGALIPNQFWHIALFADYRAHGYIYDTIRVGGAEGYDEHYIYSITSRLQIERRNMVGGVWSAWYAIYTSPVSTSSAWATIAEVFHLNYYADDVQIRFVNYETTQNMGIGGPGGSGIPVYQNNYRNSGASMKSVVR